MQINLLRKRLRFTPTPKPNTIEVKSDIQEFTRKLRLIDFFHFENLDSCLETRKSVSDPLVKNKSNFQPTCNKNTFLDTNTDFINQQNLNDFSNYKTNLSKEDWQALKEFKNDEAIVTKEADQGGAVVIMDSVNCEQMIYKQLEDKNTYKKIDPSCDNKTMTANNALIKKYENSFLKQGADYLTNFQHENSNFYGLLKIHKSKVTSKGIKKQGSENISCFQSKDLKLRPIAAGHK